MNEWWTWSQLNLFESDKLIIDIWKISITDRFESYNIDNDSNWWAIINDICHPNHLIWVTLTSGHVRHDTTNEDDDVSVALIKSM